jgi:Bifunctional DNA primase/polymerase, N-terminal
MTDLVERRRRLMMMMMMTGYAPIPILDRSKRPAIEKGWQNRIETNEAEIELYPNARSTGYLCKFTPTLDIDILNTEASEAVEALVRERFEEQGRILVRIGQPPKRAIPFKAAIPFKKISASLIAPNDDPEKSPEQKLEFLGDGQQIVAFGLHEKTGEPYRWFGGEPGDVEHCQLPYIEEAEAQRLIDDAADMLCREFGYRPAPGGKRRRANGGGNGHDPGAPHAEDWARLFENVLAGRELHDSLRDLAAKMVKAGTGEGAVVNILRALMDASPAAHDGRWQERRSDIPRLVADGEIPPRTRARARAAFMRRASASHISPFALKRAYLLAFKYLNSEARTARPSQDTLARDLGVSVRTVQRSNLVETGGAMTTPRRGVPTAASLRRHRHLDRNRATADKALATMRAGQFLHLQYQAGRALWTLSDGQTVSAEAATNVISNASVEPANDGLFPDLLAQTWRVIK